MLIKIIEMQIKNFFVTLLNILINIGITIIVAIPFTYSWNLIAPIYFQPYIPVQLLYLNTLHVFSFFLVCTYLGEQIQKLTPKIISISKEN